MTIYRFEQQSVATLIINTKHRLCKQVATSVIFKLILSNNKMYLNVLFHGHAIESI